MALPTRLTIADVPGHLLRAEDCTTVVTVYCDGDKIEHSIVTDRRIPAAVIRAIVAEATMTIATRYREQGRAMAQFRVCFQVGAGNSASELVLDVLDFWLELPESFAINTCQLTASIILGAKFNTAEAVRDGFAALQAAINQANEIQGE